MGPVWTEANVIGKVVEAEDRMDHCVESKVAEEEDEDTEGEGTPFVDLPKKVIQELGGGEVRLNTGVESVRSGDPTSRRIMTHRCL